ncbi:MAG: hypothetical protein KatS3mg102_1292 [Planctomycetota bacterium]|nr:MAG: hypothetical protein KatS3mg102_1292 [Planctomycetota bacterium]
MGELDHWQPVRTSRELGRRPLGVRLAGQELVLFRTGDGAIGALRDVCPHRGMRLSLGTVQGERLVCPYHGWRFTAAGDGESPGTPKLYACAEAFAALERHGAIWVKSRHATARFPRLEPAGYFPVRVLRHTVRAPLEVVLDNFTEVEHTGTTHLFLGYPTERLAEVETRVETTEDSVRVINRGPQRWLPAPLERLFQIRTGDVFTDAWTTCFSPVYTEYDQWWADPRTGAPRPYRIKVFVFFTPRDGESTELVSLLYTSAPRWGRLGLNRLLEPLLVLLVDLEVRLDRRMVENLADKRPSLRGRRLGRFDKALGENRRRLARIYYGCEEQAVL